MNYKKAIKILEIKGKFDYKILIYIYCNKLYNSRFRSNRKL